MKTKLAVELYSFQLDWHFHIEWNEQYRWVLSAEKTHVWSMRHVASLAVAGAVRSYSAINYKSRRGGQRMRRSTGNVGCCETTSGGSCCDSRWRRNRSTWPTKCQPNRSVSHTERDTHTGTETDRQTDRHGSIRRLFTQLLLYLRGTVVEVNKSTCRALTSAKVDSVNSGSSSLPKFNGYCPKIHLWWQNFDEIRLLVLTWSC